MPVTHRCTFSNKRLEATRKHLDKTIVVLNLPGAGGAVGLAQAAIKPANGLIIKLLHLGDLHATHFPAADFSFEAPPRPK